MNNMTSTIVWLVSFILSIILTGGSSRIDRQLVQLATVETVSVTSVGMFSILVVGIKNRIKLEK